MEEDSKDFLRIALSQIKSLPSKYDLSIRYLKNKNIGLNIKKKNYTVKNYWLKYQGIICIYISLFCISHINYFEKYTIFLNICLFVNIY